MKTMCPRCGSLLVRTTDPINELIGYFKCVDCHLYWHPITGDCVEYLKYQYGKWRVEA